MSNQSDEDGAAQPAPDGPAPGRDRRRARRLALLPIPLLLTAIVALWIADLRVAWHQPILFWLVHYGAALLGTVFILIPAARSFLANGQPSVLMLGCGVLVTYIGVAAMPLRSLDTAFAVYNTSVLLSAVCHFVGVFVTSRHNIRLKRSGVWLAAAYAGCVALMGLVIWAAFAGHMPVFYIEGHGGTLLRGSIVTAAVVLFLLTAGLLWQANRRAESPFLYWYALGLVLLGAGLTGSTLIVVKDSPLQWVTRFTQIIGLAYMCVAVIATTRERAGGGLPLAAVEEAWRENALLANLQQQSARGLLLRYGAAVVAVATALGVRQALTAWVGPGLPAYITFYPVVMAVALVAGIGPGLVATALASFVAAYWLLPPVGQFGIETAVDRLSLVIFSSMGLFMSLVADLYRRDRNKAAAYDRETALRETRQETEFLAHLLEHASQPFAVGYPDGRIGRLNLAFERLTGYTTAELRSMDWATQLTPPEWHAIEAQKLEELTRTDVPVRYEKEYIRKDGTRVPIELLVHLNRDAAGNPEYYYSFLTDISARKQAESALRETQTRLEAFAAATFEGIVESDAGRIVDCNEQLARMTGYSLAELKGQGIATLIAPEDRDRVMECVHQRRESAIEHAMLRKDGTRIIVETHGRPVSPDSTRRHTAIRDITERKRAEEAMQTALDRFYMVLSSMPAAVLLVTEDGHIEFANQAFCDAFDLKDSPADLKAISASEMIEKIRPSYLDPDEAVAHIAEIVDRGQAVRDEEVPMRSERTFLRDYVPMRLGANSYGRMWIHKDITERKWAEEALRRAKEEWERTFDSVPDLIAIMDDQHRIVRANRAMADRLGVSPAECIGELCYACVHGTDAPPAFCPHTLTLADGQSHVAEVHEDRLNGDFLVTTTPVWDERGVHIGSVHVARDITERKQAEEALRESEERFHQMFERHHAVKLVIEPESGTIVDANAAAVRFYGYSRAELCALRIEDINMMPPDEVAAERHRAVAERRNYFVFPHRLANGELRWVEVYSTPVETRGRPLLYSIIHDITARKQAEEALRESEERFRAIADNAPDLIARFDRDLRLLYANPAMLGRTGLSEEALVGRTAREYGASPASAEQWEQAAHEVLEAGEARAYETTTDWRGKARVLDTQVVPERDAAGEVQSVIAISRDITERKEAEEDLIRHNAILEGINQILDAVLTCNTEEELGQTCLAVAEKITRSPFGFIGELNERGLQDIAVSNPGWDACSALGDGEHSGRAGGFEIHGIYGRVLTSGRSLLTNDLAHHPDRIGLPEGHPPLTAFLGVPLAREGRTIGMIAVGNREGGYTEDQRDALEALAPAIVEAFVGKRAEEQLRDVTRRLSYHVDNSPLAVIEWGSDMRLTRWSGEAEGIFGWSAEEVLGKRMEDFRWVYDEDEDQVEDVSRDLQTGTNPRRFSLNRNYRKDGSVVQCEWYNSSLVDEAGSLRSILSLVLDVTERERIEEELRSSEERYRTIFNTLIEGFCTVEVIFDAEEKPIDYRFLEVNPAFEKQTGLHNAQGKLMRDLAPDHEQYWFEIYGRIAQTGEPAQFESEAAALGRWYEVSAFRVGGPESRRVAIFFNDITERKQTEQQIRRWNAELEQRVEQRTEALSDTVTALEAEVDRRTQAEQELLYRSEQLAQMASNLTMAEQRERQRLAQILHDGLQQHLVGAKLTVDMMARGRKVNIPEVATELNELIGEAIEMSRSLTAELSPPILHEGGLIAGLEWLARWMQSKHGLQVELDIQCEVKMAPDMTVLLFLAVRELLFNVIKHAGVLSAQVRVAEHDRDIRISVADEGAGFDPGQLRILGGDSEGFGLFSIRERLALLGGRMEIVSRPGHGSCFTLVGALPPEPGAALAAEVPSVPIEKVPVASEPSPAPSQAPVSKLRVLLVDDHIVMREGLRSLIREEPDMEVVGEAADGETAIRLVRELVPDVVLMDFSMSGMNGLEATRIIHADAPDVQVIGLSMYEEAELAEAMRQAGGVAYVSKSGPTEELIALIRTCASGDGTGATQNE